MKRPVATYRLQLHEGFTLRDAARIAPQLRRLGISHLYLSPITQATSGSEHGYDVTDPTRINEELGGADAMEELAAVLRELGMGVLLDIVPNHMAASAENAWWADLLLNGTESQHVSTFDTSLLRSDGKLLLPVLGAPLDEVLAAGELQLTERNGRRVLQYHNHWFPVPGWVTATEVTAELLASLPYTLADWRTVQEQSGYRRFFDITGLVGVRVEDPTVFERTHSGILQWLEAGWVDAGDDSLWASRLPLGGLVNPNDGAVNPAELIAHIASRVGDRIVPNAEVFALRSDGDGVIIESGAGVVRARRVICCLNAFASGVIPALEGVVTPRRGQMIAFRAPDARLSMSYYLNHGSEYMRQTTDGTIVLGGCRAPFADEEIGCDDATTRHVQRALEGFAQRFFPDGYEIVARWAGTMGFSPDLLPLIGPVSVDGVEAGRGWFCGGFTGHGMSLATRCAFEAVDAMLEDRRPFFPIDRVSAGAAHG